MMQMKQNSTQQQRSKTFKTEYTLPQTDNITSGSHQNNESSTPMAVTRRLNYDEEFEQVYKEIVQHQYFSKISKHEKIRINKWLTKLSNISTNDLWKKNRNNYIKLIRLMFDCEIIIAPFLMMPPQRDLHKLSPHEINVIINQVDKLLDERQAKMNDGKSTNRERLNKVQWTQESAYVDHHSGSIQKFKEQQKHYFKTETDFIKTNDDDKGICETSSVTACMSKATDSSQISSLYPPKYPTTTKHKSQEKVQHQMYFIKGGKQKTPTNSKYFPKKERINTFEEDDLNQEDCLTMMRNSHIQRRSPVFEKENYEAKNTETYDEQMAREAVNILKCGFKLLRKVPQERLQECSIDEVIVMISQMQSFRKILTQNDFLKSEFQKENIFLENILCRTEGHQALNEINPLSNTQRVKGNEKRKMKLTLISQPTHKA